MSLPDGVPPDLHAAIDAALRRQFAPPEDLPARAHRMVATAQLRARPRHFAGWLIAAAAALLLGYVAWSLQGPATPAPRAVAAALLFADEATVVAPIAACSTGLPPPRPGLPYQPVVDELLVGPLPCPALPTAAQYWSRTSRGTVVFVVLPAGDATPYAVPAPGFAWQDRQVGNQRILLVSRSPTALADCAARLR